MSGIDRITEKILEQARLQAANRIAYAKETAQKEEAGLEKRFNRTMEAEKRRAEDDGNEAAKRVIANVRLEGRKLKLSARQEAVNLVFDKAVEKIAGLPKKQYVDFLASLALKAAEDGCNKLILNTRDKEAVGEELLKAIAAEDDSFEMEIAEETVTAAGGLIIRNGDIQTNLTLESIIRLEREKLEAEVVGIIFESE